jgi:MarR family transcriptional regulator, temperature-dependent positive regulator of motility
VIDFSKLSNLLYTCRRLESGTCCLRVRSESGSSRFQRKVASGFFRQRKNVIRAPLPEDSLKNEQPAEIQNQSADSLLHDNAILEAWRLCYLANFYVFPLYSHLEKQFKITRPEWVILFCLAHQDSLCAQDIVVKTWQPKNSINRGVKLLANKGFIARREDPHDGRRVLLSLTHDGWKVYSQTLPYAITRKERLIAGLSHDEINNLNQILSKMCTNLAGRCSEATNGDQSAKGER